MCKSSIVFIGFQAVGKTTLGKMLAKETNREFIDTDQEIEKLFCEKDTIRSLKKKIGDKAFRDLEKQVLEKYKDVPNIVLATGGGAVEIEDCRNLLQSIGCVYYLFLPLERLKSRFDLKGVFYQKKNPEQFFQRRAKMYEQVANKKIEASWDQILLEGNLQ